MKLNVTKKSEPIFTAEGGKASHISKIQELERTVMSCMLWENNFYENGILISERIKSLINDCKDEEVIKLIKKVKFDMRLRHCPLWMIACLINKGTKGLSDLISSVLTRPDDMGELLALYKKANDDKDVPLTNQLKKGIAKAFTTFDEYQLGKYNRDSVYKLVDIANLCHPETTTAIDKLIKGTLETPMTWEVGLSKAGQDKTSKADVWNNLIAENKLPDMAFLKNIRGMINSGVDEDLVKERVKQINQKKLLPMDFIRAGMNNPTIENEIEEKLLNFYDTPCLKGKTAILVDVSGSMFYDDVRGNISRFQYASALAMIGRECCENVDLYTFSEKTVQVPNRRGFALMAALNNSQSHSGTRMWSAIKNVQEKKDYDRIIVITDEQTYYDDTPCNVTAPKAYILNVAPYKNGVGYEKNITHINGTSDKIFNYIECYEE